VFLVRTHKYASKHVVSSSKLFKAQLSDVANPKVTPKCICNPMTLIPPNVTPSLPIRDVTLPGSLEGDP